MIKDRKMDAFVDIIMKNLTNINWAGPAIFVVAVLVIFAFFRKFTLVLLIILTIVIGWGAQDMIILNMNTDNELINVPFLVYSIGGVTVFFLALYSFFKSD